MASEAPAKGQEAPGCPDSSPWLSATLKSWGRRAENPRGPFCPPHFPTWLLRSACKPPFSEQAAIYLFTLKFVWINRLSFVPGCYYIYTLYCKSASTKQGRPLNEDTNIFVHGKIKQVSGTELHL